MATVQKSQSSVQKSELRSVSTAKPATLASDKIAARAYEIWLANGRPHGRDQEFWFQAERELRSGNGSGRSTSR